MDRLAFKYAIIATVAVRQAFYTNDVCARFDVEPALDFEIYPTAECMEVMRRLDLVFRRNDRQGGIVVLGRVVGKNGAGDDLLRFPADTPDKLTFWMRLRRREVINFDELPPQADGTTLYYFTNQRADAAAPRNDLHLSAVAAGVDGAQDPITRAGPNYRFHHAGVVAPGTAKLKHLLTGIELAPVSIVSQAGESDLSFDLRVLPLGKCELSIGAVVKDTVYYAGEDAPAAFGVIELSLGSALGANYRIVEPDRSLKAARPGYTIRFVNRVTRWRYTVHLVPEGPIAGEMATLNAADKAAFLTELTLESDDPAAVSFTQTSASDTDIVFVSSADIASKEQYLSSVTKQPLVLKLYKHRGGAHEAVVRSDLPHPSNALIDARAAPPIYADTFLTI